MARVQPVLTEVESSVVDQVARITRSKRSDVIRNAIAVYHWYVRQAVIGARVVARRPTGEEVVLETPELSALEAEAQKLSPEELGVLARQLAAATDPDTAARLRERISRGFYGI
jgi:hypothetical protein